MPLGLFYALIGVGISVGLGGAGSSIGAGAAGKSAVGLLSKEPEKFPQALVLMALPTTQAIYGLLFGFILLIQTGLLTGEPKAISDSVGLQLMAAALPVGISCLFSGAYQGIVAGSGMKILAEKPENLSQAVVMAAILESFAIFGLVISLLIVFVGIKIV